ncbi:MAG: DUF6046 domain-containing protein [Bacteroidota bacterium]
MAKVEYDIAKLFEVVFNYRMAPYPLLVAGAPAIQAGWKSYTSIPVPVKHEDYEITMNVPRKTSNLGYELYAKNLLGVEMFMPITLGGLLLQNTIMSLHLKTTIVETPLINRKGTVKEQISIDDWDIRIKGMIVAKDNEYPDDEVKKLYDVIRKDEALEIKSVLTSICLASDEKVVVKDFSLSEMRGIQHAQGFEMNLVSDLKFELIIE